MRRIGGPIAWVLSAMGGSGPLRASHAAAAAPGMIRRALGRLASALHDASRSGPLRASLASAYCVALGAISDRLGAWPLALVEWSVGGLLAGLVIGAARRRGFSTGTWEPEERALLLAFCSVVVLHGLAYGNPVTLLLGVALGATRLRRTMTALAVRRRLARHDAETIATVAVQEAVDRHVNDPDPFGAAWRDMTGEIERLRSCRDVIADSMAEDHEIAADQLLAARAQGAAIMPPRIFQR